MLWRPSFRRKRDSICPGKGHEIGAFLTAAVPRCVVVLEVFFILGSGSAMQPVLNQDRVQIPSQNASSRTQALIAVEAAPQH